MIRAVPPRGYSRHGSIYVPSAGHRVADARQHPFWGMHGARARARGGFDPWFESDYQSNITHYFGAAAEELYLPGEPASGAITGKIAGNVLSPVTSPLHRQTLSGTHLGAGFDDGTLDSFDAAANTVHDYTGTTVAFAWLCPVLVTTINTTQRDIGLGKRTATVGWETTLTTTLLRLFLQGTLGVNAVSVPGWTGLGYIFGGVSVTANAGYLRTQTGAATMASIATTIGSLANTALTSLGSGRIAARGHVCGATLIFAGAGAETVLANAATTLPAWWAEATA